MNELEQLSKNYPELKIVADNLASRFFKNIKIEFLTMLAILGFLIQVIRLWWECRPKTELIPKIGKIQKIIMYFQANRMIKKYKLQNELSASSLVEATIEEFNKMSQDKIFLVINEVVEKK